MNAPANVNHDPTPPRTVRQLFLEYLRKSRTKQDTAEHLWKIRYEDNIGDIYESENVAIIASRSDPELRKVIGEQQFAERLANMYGQAAVLNAIELLIAEQRKTNELLTKILKYEGPLDGVR